MLAKDAVEGIRTEVEKKATASAWLELAISCAKVPIKYCADELRRQQKEEKALLEAAQAMASYPAGLLRRFFMGYDVSFHPISPEEMREWYFTPLTWIQQGQEEKVLALAAQYGIEDFYAEKYLDTLRVGAETESNELFDKSHGFYIAVIQGFFRDYYYTRGSAFSFLAEEKPEYERYFTSWGQVTPVSFPNPMQNRIIENYCSGVYLSPDQVTARRPRRCSLEAIVPPPW